MSDINTLTKELKNANERITELESRLDNLANQLLHLFEINNLKNPYH